MQGHSHLSMSHPRLFPIINGRRLAAVLHFWPKPMTVRARIGANDNEIAKLGRNIAPLLHRGEGTQLLFSIADA